MFWNEDDDSEEEEDEEDKGEYWWIIGMVAGISDRFIAIRDEIGFLSVTHAGTGDRIWVTCVRHLLFLPVGLPIFLPFDNHTSVFLGRTNSSTLYLS